MRVNVVGTREDIVRDGGRSTSVGGAGRSRTSSIAPSIFTILDKRPVRSEDGAVESPPYISSVDETDTTLSAESMDAADTGVSTRECLDSGLLRGTISGDTLPRCDGPAPTGRIALGTTDSRRELLCVTDAVTTEKRFPMPTMAVMSDSVVENESGRDEESGGVSSEDASWYILST